MKLYKLTGENYYTTNNTKWGEGVTHAVKRRVDSPSLCCDEVIHAYRNPHLGILLNPIHANIRNPVLWEAEGEIVAEDYGKVGCYALTTTRRLDIPEWYGNQELHEKVQILFAILCAESVLKYYEDKHPADDRPRKTIEAAKEYLKNPSPDAADAAFAAADAARAAGFAARAAARAAAFAAAYAAARAAARAAAFAAAYAVARAVAFAADAADELDFGKLADMAVQQIMEAEQP